MNSGRTNTVSYLQNAEYEQLTTNHKAQASGTSLICLQRPKTRRSIQSHLYQIAGPPVKENPPTRRPDGLRCIYVPNSGDTILDSRRCLHPKAHRMGPPQADCPCCQCNVTQIAWAGNLPIPQAIKTCHYQEKLKIQYHGFHCRASPLSISC